MRALVTIGLLLSAGAASAQTSDANVSARKSQDTALGGIVAPDGTLQIPTSKFSVAHPSTGRYVITFSPSFAKAAICVFEPVGAAVRVSNYQLNNKKCDVTFTSLSTNRPADTLFTFIAANAG